MRLLPLALLMLSAACATLPVPTELDASRARETYPDASLQSLAEGRKVFVSRCSGCHSLPSPDEHAPDEWPRLVGEMAKEAKLADADRALLEQFLVTMSRRPAQEG